MEDHGNSLILANLRIILYTAVQQNLQILKLPKDYFTILT